MALLQQTIERFDPPDLFGSLEEKVRKVVIWCRNNNCEIRSGNEFELLREIPNTPRVLFSKGDIRAVREVSISVVGARRPSANGVRAAMIVSRGLSVQGVTVVSGLARGIDSAAHRGALSAPGRTVAVLGHGLDRVYPCENVDLAREIVMKGGCLLSEYPPGVPPLKHHFPERNRIISGLSRGVVVVEAAEKSGSLITAKHALEQNRDVFAFPGVFDDLGFVGNHRLIQEGAKLILSVEDILADYADVGKNASDRLEIIAMNPSLVELRLAFHNIENSGSIEELFLASRMTLEELFKSLDEAKKEGAVIEVAPQRFSWILTG